MRTTAAGNTLTLASVEGISVGATITGTGIAGGTTITAINPATRVVTLSANTTGGIGLGTVFTIPNVVNSVSLTKSGTSTWVLGGTNTFTGGTNLSAGTLQFTKLASMPATGNVAAATGTTLAVNVGGAGEWTTGTSGNGTIGGLLTGLGGQAGGTVTYAGTVTLGLDTSNGPATQTYTGVIANVGTTLGLRKQGANTLELSGANTYTGATSVIAGTLTLSGNANITAAGAYTVGSTDTNATLNMSNGTYALGTQNYFVGSGNTAGFTGTVNHSGGTVSFTGGNALLVGNGVATGVYNLSGTGVLTTGTYSSATRGVIIGVNTGSSGTLNMSGGTLTLTSSSLQVGRSDTAADNTTALFNQSAGTSTVGTLRIGGNGTTSIGLNSTLTLTGGTFNATTFDRLALGNTNTATINIGGTADVTLPAFPSGRGTGSTATINFDGGTLRNSAASAIYLQGFTNAYLKNGGARFNTANGDITIAQVLENFSGHNGGLTKEGTNTLTLTGTNTYTGATNVNGGTLIVGVGGTGSLGATTTTVASGATLGGSGSIGGAVTVQAGGTLAPGNSPGTLTFTNGLTLNSGSIFNWENNTINTLGTASTNWDRASVTGGVTTISSTPTTGAQLRLQFTDVGTDFTNSFWDTNQTYASFIAGGLTAATCSTRATSVSL